MTKTHRMSHTPIYHVWFQMLERCRNPKNKDFRLYGARGIVVCQEWSRFERFYADMGPRPSAKHMIDRRDNNGLYSAENCRWALPPVQMRNKRTNRYLTANGRTMVMEDWARELGTKSVTIHHRLALGWSVEQAVTTPPLTRKLTDQQVREIRTSYPRVTMKTLATQFGVSEPTVWQVFHNRSYRDVEPAPPV